MVKAVVRRGERAIPVATPRRGDGDLIMYEARIAPPDTLRPTPCRRDGDAGVIKSPYWQIMRLRPLAGGDGDARGAPSRPHRPRCCDPRRGDGDRGLPRYPPRRYLVATPRMGDDDQPSALRAIADPSQGRWRRATTACPSDGVPVVATPHKDDGKRGRLDRRTRRDRAAATPRRGDGDWPRVPPRCFG